MKEYYKKYAEKASRCDNYMNHKTDLTIYYPESITVTLRPKYNKIIRDIAKSENVPLNALINKIIIKYLEENYETNCNLYSR